MWSLRGVPSLFLRTTLLALLAAPAALAAPASPHLKTVAAKTVPKPKPKPPSISVGSPTEGHLVNGAHLDGAPYLRIVPVYQEGDARWGLEPLVTIIDRAAKSVQKQFPDAVASIGHLSRQNGGEIDRHASHESGRDADVGFYVKNQQGKSIFADHFVSFKPDGTAATWPGAQFDDAKNWAFVSSIASEASAHVTYIFVEQHLRDRLLAYATKIGAPPAIRQRAAELMAQPRGSLPHDDHFHVRIACPAGSDKCVEIPQRKKRPAPPALANTHTKPAPHVAKAPPVVHRHPAPARPEPREDAIPSLAPMVQGLDTVIIGKPLEMPAGAAVKPIENVAPPPVIDDPDGVLDPQ